MSKTGLASRIGLAVLSTLLTLALCEVLLRVVWPTPGATNLRGLTTPDAELGYRFTPHSTKVVDGGLGDFATKVDINLSRMISASARQQLRFACSQMRGLSLPSW